MAKLEKVFKAYDIRGVYPEEVNEDLSWRIGHATAAFLRSLTTGYDRGQASSNRLVVGQDMRPSSEPLVKALIEGITSSGAGCLDIGLCDTPMVYFAINHLGTCGGIMVTASHNPIEYNGFKVSGAKARPVGEDTGLREIQRLVAGLRRMPLGASVGPCQTVDLWKDYREHVLPFLKLTRRLKVVVDASNGMGGKMIPKLFSDSDLEIIPLNFEIGHGFAHPPNPLVEANLAQLREAVVAHHADAGVCLDGDADRCVFVDERGRPVRSDLMTGVLARHFLKDNPGAVVVYDLRSSRAVAEEIRAAGGVPRRERVGHAFMKKTLADTHAVFGGELSGHFYFRDNYNCDSGAIAFASAMTVISAAPAPFSQLVAPLLRYSHSGEINFEVEDKPAKLQEVEAAFPDATKDSLDGLTCTFKDWWFNLRPSNTEPLLRLSVEAATPAELQQKLARLKEFLGEPVKH
jgi:phosphomannomutase